VLEFECTYMIRVLMEEELKGIGMRIYFLLNMQKCIYTTITSDNYLLTKH